MAEGQAAMRVLVIDGHYHGAARLASLLSQCGHRAYIFQTGEAALRDGPALKPDLVFIDRALPLLGGVHLAWRLRQVPELAATPLVAVNDEIGSHSPGAAEPGFDDVLARPYTLHDVHLLVARIRSRVSATSDRISKSKRVAAQAMSRAAASRQGLDAWWFQRPDAPACQVSFLGCDGGVVDQIASVLAGPNLRLAMLDSLQQAWIALQARPIEPYHCLVIDSAAAELDALTLADGLSRCESPPPVIMLVPPGDIPGAVRWMRAGASDVIEQPAKTELPEAIRLAFYSLPWRAARPANPQNSGPLTAHERRLLELTAKGELNKHIAREMDVSLRTVALHRAALMRKLGVGSRAELIRRAVEWGLLPT